MDITVIIPTFNRDSLLDRTLKSISRQNCKNDFEVIVIDNGSTDNTKNICEQHKLTIKNLNYHYDNTPGLLTGRHKGVEISTGEILCFLDDDVDLNPDYLENVYDIFKQNPQLKLATGPCLPEYEVPPPAWLKYFWQNTSDGSFCHWLSLLDFGMEEKTVNPNFVWGLNFCIRKDTVIELDGFHPDSLPKHLQKYQGDGETGLTRKAEALNYMAGYYPGLSLKHYVSKERLTSDYFSKRAYFEGVSKSFTAARAQSENNAREQSITRKIKNLLWPFYYAIINFKTTVRNAAQPAEIKEMKANLDKSESEGYEFHQKHFQQDEKVRNWVLKKHFWDYHISEQ